MFTNIQWVALIFSLLIIIKVLFIIFSRSSWYGITTRIFSRPKILSWTSLILAFFVLFILLREVSITQIFVSGLFMILLFVSGLSLFGDEVLKLQDRIMSKFNFRNYWWYIVLWLLLVIWVLEEVLTK